MGTNELRLGGLTEVTIN